MKLDPTAPSLTLLIKLLKMTTSSHENEALVAMRKANAELLKFGGDWESLLRGKVTVIGDPFADLKAPDVGRTTPPRPTPPPVPPKPAAPAQPPPRAAKPQAQAARPKPQPQAKPQAQAQPASGFTRPGPAPKPQAPPAWSNQPKNVQLDELI
jgi:hypothetical protein